jgi:WD40 repeat protein
MKPFSQLIAITLALHSATLGKANVLYSLNATLPWSPKNPTSVDVSIVVNGTYYLSDRSNGLVHIVDLATSTELGRIAGFVGATIINGTINKPTSGPNGLLYVPGRNELYVGDGDGTVKVVDLSSNTIVAKIPLGFSNRADEMTYDANRQIAIVSGPDDDIAVLAFITVADRKLVQKISFPNATNGIEKPFWNPADGSVYVSVPETNANPGGEIDVIETHTFKTTRIMPVTNCSQHGIVFGPKPQLLLGCSQDAILADSVGYTLIIDFITGNTIYTVNGIGGSDGVAYNPTLNLYYVAAYQYQVGGSATGAPDPQVGIIDAATGMLIQTIKSDNMTAQTVAVDPQTNKLIFPISAKGISIFDVAGTTTGNISTTGGPTTATTPTSTSSSGPTPPVITSAANRASGSLSTYLGFLVAIAFAGSLA